MAMTIDILSQRIEALEKQIALLNLNDSNNPPPEQKPKKKSKKVKDESSDSDEKPKTKRVSGYILFSNATRDEVRDNLVEKNDDKVKNTDIMKELARLWKELSDEDKEPWNAKAKEIKESA